VALVVLFYRTEGVRQASASIAAAKVAGGIPFSFLAGAIAGGFVPEIAKALTGKLKRLDAKWFKQCLFNGLVYGIVGVQVDLFYRQQTYVFGPGTEPMMLAIKTAVDMSLFSTLVSIPTAVSLYEWRKVDFSFKRLFAQFSWLYYRDKIVPALIPCWAFWIPILLCVYAMPSDLQFCFSMLAEAAWSILFVFLATNDEEAHVPA